MSGLMLLARSLHFASLISLVGIFLFLVLVAGPSFRSTMIEPVQRARYHRSLSPLIWISLIVAALSAGLWLVMEAQNMSGHSLGDVFAHDIVATVLTRTHFGGDWEIRAILAVPLIVALLFPRNASARWIALMLSAVELATLAWAGHGDADTGLSGIVHVSADLVHLLAAGAWLGGLVPLAMLFAAARHYHDETWAVVARRATHRFSILGLVSVGAILATGLINTWFLAGNAPALFGTDYGKLLLLKITLFLAMVCVAAVNRLRLTPRLAMASAESRWNALPQLQRNALIETALGIGALIVLGVLGTLPPGLHTQPWWPFSFTLDGAAASASLAIRYEVIAAMIVILAGAGAIAYGILRPRIYWRPIALGGALLIATGWLPVRLLAVATYPTSFQNSPIPLAAQSVVRGAEIYAANCVSCHGADGRGDGPLAKQTKLPPADLTAPHLLYHRVGDLYWWIGNGIPEGGMPGFADILSEDQRWDAVNFIRARAFGIAARQSSGRISSNPAPQMPDFPFEHAQEVQSLHELTKQNAVLLILYRLPESEERLAQLAASEADLQRAGLRLLAVPIAGNLTAATLDFAVSVSPQTNAMLALFLNADKPTPTEYLIDTAGYVRARWPATGAAEPPDAAELLSALVQAKSMPLQQASAHVHAH